MPKDPGQQVVFDQEPMQFMDSEPIEFLDHSNEPMGNDSMSSVNDNSREAEVVAQNGLETPDVEVEPVPQPVVSPPKPKPSSWAGLFKSNQPSTPAPAAESNNQSLPASKEPTPPREMKAVTINSTPGPILAADDKAAMELAGMVE